MKALPEILAAITKGKVFSEPLDSEKTQWFYSKTPRRAVAMVVHGLNLKPSKMNAYVTLLNSMGVDVLRVTLKGHDGDFEAFKAVRRKDWQEDMAASFNEAKAHASGLPLFAFGFSLGALTLFDLCFENRHVNFDKIVAIAPALAPRRFTSLIKVLSIFGPGLCIPSGNHRDYRAYDRTPLAGYLALFDLLHGLQPRPLSMPILVLIEEKDELVCPKTLIRFIEGLDQRNWKIVSVDSGKSKMKNKIRHLMVDEDTFGKTEWEKASREISHHLFGHMS